VSAYDRIYEITRQIPRGKVATYGQIADLAGLPGRARVVGYALYRVAPDDTAIPWQRVINAKGKISYDARRGGNDSLQRNLLEAEGIHFARDKIDLATYQWRPTWGEVPDRSD